MFSKNELEIEFIDYKDPFGKSDHSVLVFDFILEGELDKAENETPKRKVFKGDFHNMTLLFNTTLGYTHLLKEVQEKWELITSVYDHASEEFIPMSTDSSGGTPKNKWMTKKALDLINIKEKKWAIYRGNKTDHNRLNYTNARNQSVDAVREAKYNFEKSLAKEVGNGNTRAFYAYARSQTTIKEEVSRVKGPDGNMSGTSKETADVINITFQSVYVQEDNSNIPIPSYQFNGDPLEDIKFTREEIKTILSNLKETSAPGPDNIHPKVLIECADSLVNPLYDLFRASLDTGTLPSEWKTAYVTPIYKAGKKKKNPEL